MSELVVGSIAGLASNSYVVDVSAGSTLDLTNATSLPSSALPTGSVLQVVSTTKTDTFSTTSTSFTDITGLSASITPRSTSSKILVCVTLSGHGTAGSNAIHAKVLRDATDINVGDASGTRTQAGFAFGWVPSGTQAQQAAASNFLDSPSTTSSTTYKVQIRSNTTGTAYINRSSGNTDNSISSLTTSTITLMEIAG